MESGSPPTPTRDTKVGPMFAAHGIVWTLVLTGVLFAGMRWAYERTNGLALLQARAALDKDVSYRRWVSMLGGVYVPVTDSTPPNPYLSEDPERDIVTPSGRRLTLVNPSYMTRQVRELLPSDYEIPGRIVSLDPIRPENAPSGWEEPALRSIEAGAPDYVERHTLNGSPYLRVMIPLVVEESCLHCHAQQGYQLGEFRGGLSTSVPLASLIATERGYILTEAATLFAIWLLGLLGLGFALRRIRGKLDALDEARVLLMANQERLSQAQRLGSMGHYIFDAAAGTWTCSETLCAVFGMPPAAQHTFDEWIDVIHPDDRAAMLAYVQDEVLGNGQPFEREYRIRRLSDGADRWVQGHGEVELDADGNAVSMFGTIQDVTDRREAQDRIRADDARLRALVELFRTADHDAQVASRAILHEAVQLTASEGGCLTLMDASGELSGHTSELAVGDDDRCLAREAGVWDQVTVSRKTLFVEGDGEREKRLMVVPIVAQDTLVGVCSLHGKHTAYTANDKAQVFLLIEEARQTVTRALAEEALRASEERFARLAENVPDVIFNARVWPEPGLTYISPSISQMMGYTPEEIYQDPRISYDAIHPDDVSSLEDLLRGAVSPDVPLLLRWIHKDGPVVWTELRSVQVKDHHGRVVALEGVARDVTARVLAEQEQMRLQAELIQAQKMESVGRLAGGIAHDFNNMLGVILGHAGLAKAELRPGSALEADLDAILDAGRRSADLTRQLLTFARQQTIEPQALDLNEAVGGLFPMLRRLVREEVELEWKPGSDPWRVQLDPAQVDQILVNLVVNADDSIAGLGQIAVTTRNVVLDSVPFEHESLFNPGEYVELVVEDTGHGMPEEVRTRVFEPFFTTKEQGKGTGLGLATVYGIVRQNEGWIDIVSEVGKGSRFIMWFPRIVDDNEDADQDQQSTEDPKGEGTILVVEDDPGLLALTVKLLHREGYHVLEAASPMEAMTVAQDFPDKIAMLLTDVVMPGMNGLELARTLQQSRPGLPVVFMSGYPDTILTERGVLLEGVRLLQKPFTRHGLVQEVSDAVREED